MKTQINPAFQPRKTSALGAALALSGLLAGCATFTGIGSDKHIAAPAASTQSLPSEHGNWPAANWTSQFGDAQLDALVAEALRTSPTIDQARARIAAAAAFTETARSATGAKVNADYTLTRQQYSSNALVPPPYAGSLQNENKAVVSASYELDLWGKNSAALASSLSKLRISTAAAEQVKLSLSNAVARSYNELARQYALRDLAARELDVRRQMRELSARRSRAGLDSDVEQQHIVRELASGQASITAIDGRILDIRYQLAALLGAGPDRGLTIARPTMGAGGGVALPDSLPADLLARRPDIVMARWSVDASTEDVKVAKADFYPDINLAASIGLDAFGFGRLFNASSRTLSAGPAIHLPIFDSGALRAQLKDRYAQFDFAVAAYQQTLVSALSEVATDVARVHATDAQLLDAQAADEAAHRSLTLSESQYRAGLSTQLVVQQSRLTALNTEEALTTLRMNRRDQQIALAAAMGGGFGAPAEPAAAAPAMAAK
ncbi:efflux transporter outer membrane subunit [Rugamonas sp.]|uniref:efflux transporter outer membrane subunit n=1 Tax=Rugamonas sp. TaxID=1926287 RepID=UPI0025E12E5C|nr:efflux transporter outer membrane subunit [Rugamonas sp.]